MTKLVLATDLIDELLLVGAEVHENQQEKILAILDLVLAV